MVGAQLDRLNGGVDCGERGNDNDEGVGVVLHDPAEHAHPIKFGQLEVQQDEIKPAGLVLGQGRFAVSGGFDRMAPVAEDLAQQVPEVLFVIDDEDRGAIDRHGLTLLGEQIGVLRNYTATDRRLDPALRAQMCGGLQSLRIRTETARQWDAPFAKKTPPLGSVRAVSQRPP